MTGCTSLGPNSGSFSWRSNKLSSGLQKAYSVPASTANRLSPMIIQSADQYNVPPLLLAAVIRQESSYNSNARSPTGAVGLTQIIPSYWQQTCAGNLYDETTNIQCGAYILNHYYATCDGWWLCFIKNTSSFFKLSKKFDEPYCFWLWLISHCKTISNLNKEETTHENYCHHLP